MCDRGHFQNSNFLATLHQKNTAIVIRIYTTEHVQSLSSFGPNLVEIFKVVERWVVVGSWSMTDVWAVLVGELACATSERSTYLLARDDTNAPFCVPNSDSEIIQIQNHT